ncbi:MAG: hypothetical protein ACXAEU_20815 [Candidatus Hodarchaeales archaeon]|jgi:hypothetical protein
MKTVEAGYIALVFLVVLEISLLIIDSNPVSFGVFVALLGQFVVLEGVIGIGGYCHWYKKKPTLINMSPAFITGALSILGGLITIIAMGSPEIRELAYFPQFELLLGNDMVLLGYYFWVATCNWLLILIGLLMLLFDHDTRPTNHLRKTILMKRSS